MNRSKSQKIRRKPQSYRLPEFTYMIPVRYDSAFRSKVENERLRKTYPEIKSISVKPRDQAKTSPNKTQYVQLTIAAPNKQIANACYQDGSKTIRKKMENNAKKGKLTPRTSHTNKTNKTKSNKTNKTKSNKTNKTKSNKTKSNNRPLLQFPEEFTSKTNWADYMNRYNKYQINNPEHKVV
jgi:hypothetical protein